MSQLVWNNNSGCYESDYGDGRTLYVDGDAWSEARLELAKTLLGEKYPDWTQDQVAEAFGDENNQEAQEIYEQATDEMLDPGMWDSFAVEMDKDGNPLSGPIDNDYSAWIK